MLLGIPAHLLIRMPYAARMANPAQLLLDQFRSWNRPVTAEKARIESREDPWLDHRIAVRHLDAIEELLNQMADAGRNTSVFQRTFPEWVYTVFVFNRGWQAPSSGAIDRTALDHLENLADRLDDFVPTLQSDGLEKIANYADRVSTALDSDNSLDPLLKLHVRQVITHLKWCVDHYAQVGDFDLQEATERLASSVIRAAANSADKSKWNTVVETFVWPFAVNVVAAIPGSALAALVLGAG
ncbi:hypothetical protein [Mycobacterium sp. NPDC050853]|uniref:hypothetical protein n=1 Tax=Mycobacterium sp. NPDC050853 TaxID=3155160 RepID=UPI0033D02713